MFASEIPEKKSKPNESKLNVFKFITMFCAIALEYILACNWSTICTQELLHVINYKMPSVAITNFSNYLSFETVRMEKSTFAFVEVNLSFDATNENSILSTYRKARTIKH